MCALLALSSTPSCLRAADKSGVSPNTISVPKGPGSIEGLGESFQPSLNSGTANYGIALQLPPGTAGQTPALRLGYEGGGGNGPLGFGWELGIPSIQRRSDKGIPLYSNEPPPTLEDDWTDRYTTFLDTGKEELVPQTNGDYFGRVEGAFVRYRRQGGAWEGAQPDGSRLEFGLTEAARIQDGPDRVFSWLLERETDTHGNTITYAYASFPDPQNQNQKYLREIRYGPGAPPWDNFHFVVLVYEDRPDWFEDCRSGFPVRTGKRLRSIVIGTQGPDLPGHLAGDFNGDGIPDYLDRRYDLDYLNYAGPDTHWSLLAKVTLVGADGVTALPPATHGYTVSNPPEFLSAAGKEIGGINEPPLVMDSPYVDFADLNGDGLPDILRTYPGGGSHQAFLNAGQTQTNGAPAIRWRDPASISGDPLAAGVNLQSITDIAHLSDMDGDGLADLVYRSAFGDVYYFANRATLSWGDRQFMSVGDTVPPSPFGTPAVKTADLDFDKRMDIIQSVDTGSGADYRIWFNLGDSAYARSTTVPQAFGVGLSTPGVQIADFNGDRVPDIVRVRPMALSVSAGFGYGRFGDPVSVSLPDYTLDDAQVAKAALDDVTGDGLPDLVIERAAPGQLWYWVNLGNYALSRRKIITDLPTAIGANAVIRWADINGNGTTDLVYADSSSEPRLRAVDIGQLMNVEAGPNILTAISNGIGGMTLIGYLPSTRFSLDDAAAGSPWPESVPFPVQVVSAITNLDSLGHQYVTRFRYHDGYYDPIEKQFRGFARAEQIDVGDPEAPTLVARSHFDTGKTWRAMKGKLLRLTTEQEDGRVFTDQTTQWVDPPVTLMTGTNGEAVTYAHPTGSVKRIIELGQGEERRLESEFAYDRYGNETTNADYGIVVDGDRSAFDDERITTTEYAINTNVWILRLPSRQEIQDEHGVVISRVESFYDDETFSGTNLGQVTIGNLTLKREWIDAADRTNFVASTRIQYDAYGNPRSTLDPLAAAPAGVPDFTRGHGRSLEYDSGFHTSPVRETIHVGAGSDPLLYEADYDEGFGILTRSLDFNGHTTTYVLDALARLIQIIRPGDTPSFPSSEFEYALAVPLGGGRLVNYVVTRQLDREPQSAGPDKRSHYFISRQFTDGMGRALMARAEAEPAVEGGPPRVVVSGATRFNARRTAARALNPFFTTVNSENLDDLLTFESIEAADWKGLFEENGTLVELDLASAHQAATRYDATLRPIETENPDGTRKRTSYEPLLTKFFDENDSDPASQHSNTPTLHHNDGLGRLVRLGEITRLDDAGVPGGTLSAWTTRYEYDLHDQLVRATDSQGNVKWMTYDGLKRKTFINDPDRGVAQFSYDAGSNLRESLDAKGQRITITYDGLNRPEAEDLHDEASSEFSYGRSPDVIYHYDRPAPELDQGDNTRAEAENVKGRLAWVEDVSGEEHSSYDARNRVTWTVKRIRDPRPDSNTLVSYRTGFAYDVADRLTQVTYPDNDAVRYEYNERGLLRRIAGGPNALVLSNLSYWASGRPGEIHYGSGVRSHYQHDPRLRLKELGTRNSELGTELVHYGYDFDSASNIKSIADLRPGSAVQEGHPRRNTQLFQYDDLHRLTRVQYSFHLPGQTERNDGEITYRYDRIGNMLAQTSTLDHREKGLPLANLGEMDSGGALGRWNRLGRATNAPPGPHALTSIRNPQSAIRNYSYDANGSMTVIDGLTNTWDFKDRLVTVESAEMRAEYAYDHTGRRIIKRVAWKPGYPLPSDGRGAGGEGGVTTVSYVNKYFEVSEHDAPVKYVWNGSVRIARVTGSLSDNPRLQRLRVYPGWNLVSLAVTATNALEQLMATPREPGFTLQAFRWEPATQSWIPVEARETLPAGSVCWLKVSKNATLSILGPYPGPPVQPRAPPGGDFLPGAGFEVWSPAWPDTVQLWRFDASTQQWHSKGTAPLADSPSDAWTVAPGEAVFVRAPEIIELALPDPRLNVRYYHPDHLGSAAAISDADGRLVEETAFYPFGHPRHEWRPQGTEEPYQFAQKERDRESDLQYFEARYHSGVLARFTRADPLVLNMPGAWLASPQEQNLYAFARNNPLKFIDPTGLKITVAGSWYGEGYRYRQDVAEALRRLDPSARVSRWTGEVSFGAKPNPLLPRSRELLTRLVTSRQTVMIGRTSASLVDLATSSDQRAGLEQYDYNASGAQAGPSKTGAMVLWQAGDRNWGITVGPEGGRGRQLFQETTSGFIALAHELIHAGHQIDGGMSSAIKDKQERYQGIKWDVSAEELRTVGLKDVQNQSYAGQRDITENMIRAEHGHTRRAVYGLH